MNHVIVSMILVTMVKELLMIRDVMDKEDASGTRMEIMFNPKKGIAQSVLVLIVAHIVLLFVLNVYNMIVHGKEKTTAMENASGVLAFWELVEVVLKNK